MLKSFFFNYHSRHCAPRRYNLFVEMTAQVRRNVIYNVYMFQPARVKPAEGSDEQTVEVAATSSSSGNVSGNGNGNGDGNGNGSATASQPAVVATTAKAGSRKAPKGGDVAAAEKQPAKVGKRAGSRKKAKA
jgi:hypothetical protein